MQISTQGKGTCSYDVMFKLSNFFVNVMYTLSCRMLDSFNIDYLRLLLPGKSSMQFISAGALLRHKGV